MARLSLHPVSRAIHLAPRTKQSQEEELERKMSSCANPKSWPGRACKLAGQHRPNADHKVCCVGIQQHFAMCLGCSQRQRAGLAHGPVGGYSPPVVLAACIVHRAGRLVAVARSPTGVAGSCSPTTVATGSRLGCSLWSRNAYGDGYAVGADALWLVVFGPHGGCVHRPDGLRGFDHGAVCAGQQHGPVGRTLAFFAPEKPRRRHMGYPHCRFGLGRELSMGLVDGLDARSGALVHRLKT